MSDFDIITKGFIKYLQKTGQISKLPNLAKEQIHASRTVFDPNLAVVQSVIKLNPAQTKNIQSALSKIFARPIKVKTKLNPQILGGLLIRIGDQVIDLSFKTKINSIKDRITA